MRVAVVGGGIAGLAAAWELRHRAEVTVWEPGRLGGRILTEPFEGRAVDCGADAFITRVPEGLEMCREAGVTDLVHPAAGGTLVWWDGRARALPEGLMLGVPRRLGPLLRSGLLTPAGMARAAADVVLPSRLPAGDISVRELVSARFGAQVADRLVDPLIGGIHAGDTAQLSAASTAPQLLAVARRSRSMLLGLRAGGAGDRGPVFAAPRGGMGELVAAVVSGLVGAGVTLEASAVGAVVADGKAWRLEPSGRAYDGVVLATPDRQAAALLGPGAPGGLGSTPRASVALVTLGYGPLPIPAGVNGILVPRRAGMLTTACSLGSAKWPHWAEPGRSVLRVSTGRAGDERAVHLDDTDLVERLAAEVGTLLGTTAAPDAWRVRRWPDSFPQYVVGHGSEVAGLEAALARTHPGVVVCGSSYHGAGVPACIASGRRAARTLLQ